MARIAAGLIDQIWAATPASADDVITPPDARQESGWTNDYFQPGGSLPEGEHFNALWNRQTAFGYDVGRHGILEWSADQDYEHPAAVLASNNHLYLSVASSGPNMTGGAVDPTGATGTTRWRLGGAAHDFVPAPQVTGTADAIELAPDPAFTVYQEGQTLVFRAEGDSTSGVTINVSGLGAVALHFAEGPAGAGLVRQGDFYQIRYDGTVWVVMAETPYAILPVSRGGTGVSTVADLLAALNIGNRLIPDGGTDGQVLTKASGTNFDADWEDAASAGLQTLTEGDHIDITGSGDSREIAVETGTTQGDLAVLGTGGRFSAMRVPQLDDLEGTLTANQVPDLPDLNGTLDIASGGTGSTTAADARTALGLGTAAVRDTGTVQNRLALLGSGGRFAAARIPDLDDLNGTLDVASGGTGATDAAGARANLSAAAANHNHDGRYYTETEADARFSRNASLTNLRTVQFDPSTQAGVTALRTSLADLSLADGEVRTVFGSIVIDWTISVSGQTFMCGSGIIRYVRKDGDNYYIYAAARVLNVDDDFCEIQVSTTTISVNFISVSTGDNAWRDVTSTVSGMGEMAIL